MASSLPSLQVRKGSAVNEFLGRLIEKMAEVGTRSSMTSNHKRGHAHHHHMHVRATYTDVTIIMWPLIPDPFLHHSCTLPPQQQLPSGNNKTIHNQGVGERSEPHSLYYNKHVCVCALRKVTGNASTSSQMLLLLWTMAIVGHRKGAQ